MEEVADTLRELGVDPLMTMATVKRQREMGQIGKQQAVRRSLPKGRAEMLERDQRGGARPALSSTRMRNSSTGRSAPFVVSCPDF